MSRRGPSVLILLATLLLLPVQVSAQQEDATSNPVKWTVKANSKDPSRLIIELTAEIERGWHLYSTERVEGGPSPTRITLPSGQTFEISGEIDSPAPQSAYDSNFQVATEWYEGSVTFKLPVKSLKPVVGAGKVRVQVRYQTCTANICLAPKLLELEATVDGSEAKPVEVTKAETSTGNLVTVGTFVPDFEFTDFKGQRHSFSEFRGRAVLLDFWASWCGPCLADIPELKKYHARGLEIIGMNSETIGQKEADAAFLKDAEARAREIVATRGVNWPQSINATSLPVALRFGVESLPAKFLIDPEGRLIARIDKLSVLDVMAGKLLKSER